MTGYSPGDGLPLDFARERVEAEAGSWLRVGDRPGYAEDVPTAGEVDAGEADR